MKWTELVPADFKRLARDPGVCAVPIGSLERHGEHLPYGCDGLVADSIVTEAADRAGCVSFPVWYFGQVHEASCFDGTVNFPPEMLIGMLRQLLREIARNGFRKIVLYSGHGGNTDMLHFFDMATLDEPRDYALYIVGPGDSYFTEEERRREYALMETDIMGHADEHETSLFMGCCPGLTKPENNPFSEPIPNEARLRNLHGIHSGLWWYAMYPENVGGTPSAATEEKGRALRELYVTAFTRALEEIKEDTSVRALYEEFHARRAKIGKEPQ